MNKISTVSLIALGAVLSLACAVPAFADGMPNEQPKAAPTQLDKALMEIHGETTEAPVPVTVAPPAEEVQVNEVPVEEPKAPETEQAKAPEPEQPPAPENRVVEVQPNSSFFGLSVGLYDITHGKESTSFSLEFQPGVKIAGVIQPIFGAALTTQGTVFAYTGVGVPVHATQHLFLMPSVAAGLYKKGDGVDLGQKLAFRVGSEIGWEFDNKSRLGFNVHAIGNGDSLRRKDRTEIFSVVYTTPLENLKKGG